MIVLRCLGSLAVATPRTARVVLAGLVALWLLSGAPLAVPVGEWTL